MRRNANNTVRDQQRQRVYDWERANVPEYHKADMTLEECEKLIARVCADYRINMPRITDGRGTKYARGGYDRINLPRWARSIGVVLHETAHVIAHQKLGALNVAGHGPEFMRIFLDLLVKYAKLPARELCASATKAGLRVAQTAACPKPIGREEKRLRAEVDVTRKAYDAARAALHAHLVDLKSQK